MGRFCVHMILPVSSMIKKVEHLVTVEEVCGDNMVKRTILNRPRGSTRLQSVLDGEVDRVGVNSRRGIMVLVHVPVQKTKTVLGSGQNTTYQKEYLKGFTNILKEFPNRQSFCQLKKVESNEKKSAERGFMKKD